MLVHAVITAGRDKVRKPDKLSLVTKQLWEKPWKMKRNGTDVQHTGDNKGLKSTKRKWRIYSIRANLLES